MTHLEHAAGGRPSARAAAVDGRWPLLDAVADARADWGLTDRSVAVLRALLTFLPQGERVATVVFPSNRTLAKRLMGMPESTLRRHLARLVAAGLVARRRSPNGKRYRVGRGADALAFGLDLGPFFAAGRRILEAARDAADRRDRARVLRARVRIAAARAAMDGAARAEIARRLRRVLGEAELRAMLATVEAMPPAPDGDAAGAQSERHTDPEREPKTVVAEAMDAVGRFADTRVRCEADLERVGGRAAQGMQITGGWDEARRRHGPGWGMMALAYLLRLGATVRRPDAYLRALARRAERGAFDVVEALARKNGGGWAEG